MKEWISSRQWVCLMNKLSDINNYLALLTNSCLFYNSHL